VTEAGDMVAGTGSRIVRYLPLRGYQPLQYAFIGQPGSMATQSPDSAQDHLVAYSLAKRPRFAVLVTQPMEAAFATTNFLATRLSVLLLPFLALLATGIVGRLRTARTLEDLTRKLENQNERLRAADKAKSDFLAQVSHDLRTPLAAMSISLSSLLEDQAEWDADQARQSLFVVNGEVSQLTARVQSLLEMARLEAGVGKAERELRDLTDIVAAAVERLDPLLRGRQIHETFPDEPLLIECDQGQIEKVVMNLLENAIKYSPPGSALHLHGGAYDGQALFTIRDEGPGLEPGDEERVFDKFYRADRTRSIRGTGLGLSICRAIIREHGGAIGASPVNAEKCGAEFWFTLPLLRMP
jgi:two-component system sensor histidine kinase KdpD